tara:strand:+ start:970 stop:1806 length:837 start_codon:yes stop_codon:yes gene_type:complete
MKILIIGLGSIAKKHIHALGEVVDDFKLYALRSSANPDTYPGITNVTDAEGDYDYAIISSPSVNHLDDIKKLSNKHIPVMVEKPFLTSREQIEEFKTITPTPNIYVACNMRFIPSFLQFVDRVYRDTSKVNEVTSYCGSYLPNWRATDYRDSYSAQSKLGGGVNLDLIHEFDLLYYMFGKPDNVIKRNKKYSTLELDTYDYSNYILEYKNFEATVKLNYFRRDYKRYIEVVKENRTYYWELDKKEVSTSYVEQMRYFIESKKYTNDSKEAIEVLNIVL